MPLLQATTKDAQQVWASPDGAKAIWQIALDINGTIVKAKTYSKAISVPGWNGEVESYEKQGKFGSETFVKQPQREGGWQGGGNKGSSKPNDPYTMYMSYAKDLAIALTDTTGFDGKRYQTLLDATISGANALYAARPDGPGADAAKAQEVFGKTDVVVEDLTEDQENDPWAAIPNIPTA